MKVVDAKERTLCIIKPDAVTDGHAAAILQRIADEGFTILAQRTVRLTDTDAGAFYAVHDGKGFWDDLIGFMTNGPIVAVALERENAVVKWREIIGATDPAKAAPGTLRQLYGTAVNRNVVHGSDSKENGAREVAFFFCGLELGDRLL